MLAIRKILVPTDFSSCSRAALELAEGLAAKLDAEVDLLYVWEPPLYVTPEMYVALPNEPMQTVAEYAQEQAGKELDAWLRMMRERGTRGTARIAQGGATPTILKQAEGYDLIVMGTHGRSGLSHFVMGSVAERVVRRAPCPVVTVRGEETAKASKVGTEEAADARH